MDEKNILGERIKERRQALHISQSELANKLGYSDKTAISKIENGINDLTQSKIVAFADALQTSYQYLLGWVDNPDLNLTPQESRLLAYWKLLNDTQKESVINIVKAMTPEKD